MSASNWPTILTLLIVLAKVNRSVSNAETSFQPIFQTEETVRRHKARDMQAYINETIDPCVDFYEYACGKRQTQPQSSKITSQQARIDAELLRLLDEPVQGEDSLLARQSKEFYKSCLNAQAHQSQQQQLFLSEFIQQNGGFPAVPGANWHVHHHNYNWVQVLGKLRRHYGMDILIGLRIGYNYANVHENSIYLAEPSMRLPLELCRKRMRGMKYELIEQSIAEQLKAWLALGNDESKSVAADILSFEHELCGAIEESQLWNADLQLYRANYTRKTLAEFTQLFGQGQLDFNEYVSASAGQTIVKPVYMSSPGYYRQLVRNVTAHNMSQVANYIMYRALNELTFPLKDQLQRRPAYCLGKLKRLLPMALGELYARQYANDDVKRELQELYAQLQAALLVSLHADWLEEGTRRAGERKLRQLVLTLPSYERPKAYNLQLERTNYWHNLRQLLGQVQMQEMNRLFEDSPLQPSDPIQAYELRVRYQPLQRRIDLGWALLQSPVYDVRYGHAISYATLGPLLAQQLAAAFDDVHWSLGLLEDDSWEGLTAWRYHNRSSCFAQQVADYLQPNASAVQQLISSSAALNIAFRAYITWLGFLEPHNEFTRLNKETLPGINYSNTALFFVAYAQQHCHLEPEPAAGSDFYRTYSARQRHSWTRLAVNGPLRNMADFAREFRCLPGTPMNPADKCVIY